MSRREPAAGGGSRAGSARAPETTTSLVLIVRPDTRRPEESTGATLLFDGACNLCNASVRWVIARDRRARFRFASLQSRAGREALARRLGAAAASPAPLSDSVVLLDEAGVHVRSDAALRVARLLGFPCSLLAVAALVPRGLRDALYDWIAANRYRWFGRCDACTVPTPELRARFLDADERREVSRSGGAA